MIAPYIQGLARELMLRMVEGRTPSVEGAEATVKVALLMAKIFDDLCVKMEVRSSGEEKI